ncbi:hypothetical protein SAMN02745108_02421 [Fibrobacter intestinalis]|uniref:G domain-containing protein n=2 Tax=Fibrobacteraceae TaxID=204431 RepID=A0A1T4QVQ8_9BACT|nr:hypothetical protein BGW94_2252 [Fibrobacter sp. NR9]SKA07571.1 hypothetical protein SAMN02745108_02421 [Fibrobacter intestinalis]
MKIILLAGNANVGKTSTMNIVYDRLIREGAILDKGTPPEQSEKRKKDFECVLLYKGQKVAVHSEGDFLNECFEAIERFRESADILVLACRKRMRAKLEERIKKFSMECEIVEKMLSDDEQKALEILQKI